jgi:hypothetical protein
VVILCKVAVLLLGQMLRMRKELSSFALLVPPPVQPVSVWPAPAGFYGFL